jgi:hypothetical protein
MNVINILLIADGDIKEIGNKYIKKRRALLIFFSLMGK